MAKNTLLSIAFVFLSICQANGFPCEQSGQDYHASVSLADSTIQSNALGNETATSPHAVRMLLQIVNESWQRYSGLVLILLAILIIKIVLLRQSFSEVVASGLVMTAFLLKHAVALVIAVELELRKLARDLRKDMNRSRESCSSEVPTIGPDVQDMYATPLGDCKKSEF